MDSDVTALCQAEAGERSPLRENHRNGYRERDWETRLGTMALKIPKLRQGSYLPDFLEPRRHWERAFVSVVSEAYVAGVSTRKVEQLVEAMGAKGMSRSEVSRLAKELDAEVTAFRERAAGRAFPLHLAGCHVPQGPGRAASGGPGRPGRDRGEPAGLPGGARPGGGGWRNGIGLERVPGEPGQARPGRGGAGGVGRPHRAEGSRAAGPERRVLAAVPGAFHAERRREAAQGRPGGAPGPAEAGLPGAGQGRGHEAVQGAVPGHPAQASQASRPCWTRPWRTSWSTWTSRRPTGGRSIRPTSWSGRTASCAADPTWSASSRTGPRSCGSWAAFLADQHAEWARPRRSRI